MAANGPSVNGFQLRLGVDELIYSNLTATGIPTLQPAGSGTAVFGFPPQSSNYRGTLILGASPIGGTITTATISLLLSLDGGTTFGVFNKLANFSGATAAVSAYSGIPLIATGTAIPIAIDISGCGGSGQFAINLTTLTKGTGTGINIFGRMG